MIQEQLAHLPEFLPGYRPFPLAQERTAWQGLPLRAKQRFLQAGEAALQTPIAPLPLSLWLDFTHTGRRTPWETAYFSRRARLCALVSAECVEHKGRFLGAIADTVWALCEESAWQLPAHNSYVRDTPQLPLPDTTRPIVDLFAAETGALLALTRYLLPDELDTAAPGITARMERELNTRILTPYFTSHFWWMGNGEEPMCNWTSWCTQNVLLTVFLLPTTQQQRQAAVKQAAYSLDCFLKDYGADGCCNEGAQYYRHAGLTLWGCLEILSSIVPEAFSPLFHEPKIKNIAEYICNVHVEGPYYLNFGDCSPLAGRCGAREYRFGQAVGSDALQALAAADFRADADPDHLQNPDGSTHINLWYRLTTAFAEDEMMAYSAAPRHHLTVWYPSVGVYAARQGSWVLGAKFGSNGDTTTTIPAVLPCTRTADRFSSISGWRATPKRPSAPSGMKSGPCRAHGTICPPLTACSSCPARNTLHGRCAPRKIASPANWRARTRPSRGLPPTAAAYLSANRASPCGTKRTIPARWS